MLVGIIDQASAYNGQVLVDGDAVTQRWNDDVDQLDEQCSSAVDMTHESDDDDLLDVACCTLSSNTRTQQLSPFRLVCRSKLGRLMLFIVSLLSVYLLYSSLTSNDALAEGAPPSANLSVSNRSRARAVLSALCDAYQANEVSGDICHRLCFDRDWTIVDLHESSKFVVTLRTGGQDIVLKSQYPRIEHFQQLDPRVSEEAFTDASLDLVNYTVRLGWPTQYKRHLIEAVWPKYKRTMHAPLSNADRRSLWALLSQDEYITFRVLPLSRVTPKIIGTCGHFYQVEHLIAFHMKGYYMNLKAKILVHLMGTLKLFDEFLNEPLQWCDVKFDNLGLAADYPKRFMVMDADMLYTKSRLDTILTSRICTVDSDCVFFDCASKCNNATGYCTQRTNNNVDVFCQKLVHQLFGKFWSKSNRYLAACHDTSISEEQRLANLRLAWSWNLSDV
uniref:Protein FAM69C n=1 Tax=Ascaris suum TaxID=6253 RepID=F1L328_ASCSU